MAACPQSLDRHLHSWQPFSMPGFCNAGSAAPAGVRQLVLLALVLALQAESVAPPSTAYRHIEFDLAGYGISEVDYGIGALRCRRDHDPQAIIVCANRDGGAYPLRQMERRYG